MTDPGGKVEVAVALPVAGTFHYRVGPKWRDDITPGRRVLVPFGNRRVTGYVLGRAGDEAPEAPPLPRDLKEIIQPLDDEPLFGPEMTSFFRFTAWYYHHPIGLVIAEALPTGLKVMSHRTAHLTPDGQAALDQSETDPDEARLLGRLKKGRGQPLTRLAQDHPAGLVRSLVERGWVRVDDQLSRDRVALRTETWVHLEPARTDLSFRLGSREKEILGRLRDQSPLCASDLAGDGPTITPILQRLEKKNWVRLEQRPVYRDALGRSLDFGPEEPTATPAQSQAIDALAQALEEGVYAPFLLFGVTGSGKTLVYLAAARDALRRGRGVLWLVPEISLAPALEGLLRVRLDQDVAVLHSGLPPAERYDQWMKIRRGLARVAIGARSGVFAPIDNLGLVVVDEEHDGAYKQEDGLRYHARDLAVLRARQTGAVVVLGSATPAMETYGGAQSGRYRLLTLAERVGAGRLPRVDVVDMRSGRADV
jgi:primosomal protein N' (replication factor Y)